MELLIELLIEVAVYVLFELVAAGVLHPIGAALKNRQDAHPLVKGLGYAMLGAVFGGLSVLVWPAPFVNDDLLKVVSMIVSPIAAGSVMALVGWYLKHRDRPVLALESFGYGFVFAAVFGVLRHFLTSSL